MKLFTKKLSIYLLFPLGILLLNIAMDPLHNLAPTVLEKDASLLIVNGQNAPASGNLNFRQLRKQQIGLSKHSRDIAVFGGSTVLEIGCAVLDSSTVNNFTIPNHSVRDIMGLYDCYNRQEEARCKHFLFGCSPYFFLKERSSVERWIPLKTEYLNMLDVFGQYSKWDELETGMIQFKQFISVDLSRRSFSLLINGDRLQKPSIPKNVAVVFPDGSCNRISFSDSIKRANSIDEIPFTPGFTLSSSIDHETVNLLIDLVHHAGLSHQKTFVFLTPFSPSFYAEVIAQNAHIGPLEKRLRETLAQNGAIPIGSFNPANIGLEENDFMDPMHVHPTSIKKYLDSIRFEELVWKDLP